MRTIIGIAALAAALSAGGCIEKETTHSIYLSPDGAVAWTTLERDVRSDAAGEGARRGEEAEYLAAAVAGTNPVAAGLAALEPPQPVRTRVLRRERPFSVLTEARFPAADVLGLRILGALRVPGDVYLTTSGEVTTLHIHLDLRAMDDDEDDGSAVLALVDELSTYRIVLAGGRFVAAEGFSLDDSGTVARPIATSEEVPDAVVDLSLSWRR